MIEKRFGRSVLVECLSEPRQLLAHYNQAATEQNAGGTQKEMPLWSPELLQAVGIEPTSAR